jgi:transcriptional regulator NrdR family protein
VKCPTCAADSEVLETRPYRTVFLRRVRKCFNGHRFSTYEVFPGNLDRRTIVTAERAAADRKLAWQRKQAVANSTEPATKLATRLGITSARVKQIRDELKEDKP